MLILLVQPDNLPFQIPTLKRFQGLFLLDVFSKRAGFHYYHICIVICRDCGKYFVSRRSYTNNEIYIKAIFFKFVCPFLEHRYYSFSYDVYKLLFQIVQILYSCNKFLNFYWIYTSITITYNMTIRQ